MFHKTMLLFSFLFFWYGIFSWKSTHYDCSSEHSIFLTNGNSWKRKKIGAEVYSSQLWVKRKMHAEPNWKWNLERKWTNIHILKLHTPQSVHFVVGGSTCRLGKTTETKFNLISFSRFLSFFSKRLVSVFLSPSLMTIRETLDTECCS